MCTMTRLGYVIHENQEFSYTKGEMEEILNYVRWVDADFVEMNARLFDFQENNYKFWDLAERDVIEKYLMRCKQLEPVLNQLPIGEIMKANFRLNWSNLLTALGFIERLRNQYEPLPIIDKNAPSVLRDARDVCVDKCDGSWESQKQYYDEIPIKQAIREGKGFLGSSGSSLSTPNFSFLCSFCSFCSFCSLSFFLSFLISFSCLSSCFLVKSVASILKICVRFLFCFFFRYFVFISCVRRMDPSCGHMTSKLTFLPDSFFSVLYCTIRSHSSTNSLISISSFDKLQVTCVTCTFSFV